MSIDRAEQKLSEIMISQEELLAQSEEVKRLLVIERDLEQCVKKCTELRERITELETERGSLDLEMPQSAIKAVEYDRQLAKLKNELVNYEKDLGKLRKNKDALQYIVDNNKNFDKNKLFRNIRQLLSSTGVKLGQIEKDAGCQPGYMSRLEKAGNTTDPSVEFVVTAAKELEVSIDLLIYGDFEKMTPTELYILKFLNTLIRDTKNDNMGWKINDLRPYVKTSTYAKTRIEPFSQYIKGVDVGTDSIRYRSLFFSDKIVTCVGNCYKGKLKGSDAMMYIMNCTDSLAGMNEIKQFFELYIVDNHKVNPLFCTAQTSEGLISAVDQLYEVVEVSATHIHINDKIRTIIELYLDPPFA